MTGNLKVLSAKWATVCGEIVFTTNFSRRKYALRVQIGEGLSICDLDTAEPRQWGRVEREEVLAIIRQGDDAMWTWQSFLAMWQGWAVGYEVGRDSARCNCFGPNQ